MTRRQQGHPARTNRDELTIEIERLATRVTKLVPQIIRSATYDPEDVVVAKAASIGLLHLLAVASNKPTPAEIYGHGKHGYHQSKDTK